MDWSSFWLGFAAAYVASAGACALYLSFIRPAPAAEEGDWW